MNGDIGQAILNGINEIKTSVGALEARMDGIETRLATIETRLTALSFLDAAARRQMTDVRTFQADVRDMKTKLDEIYGSMATSPKISRLREEVATNLEREQELDIRITTIETHLGLKNPLATE
jgi:uncharacterized coiled-coil protein SlyX